MPFTTAPLAGCVLSSSHCECLCFSKCFWNCLLAPVQGMSLSTCHFPPTHKGCRKETWEAPSRAPSVPSTPPKDAVLCQRQLELVICLFLLPDCSQLQNWTWVTSVTSDRAQIRYLIMVTTKWFKALSDLCFCSLMLSFWVLIRPRLIAVANSPKQEICQLRGLVSLTPLITRCRC